MRKKAPMPLDTLRKKQASQASEIAALKAGVLELQSRMAKAETALGTIGKVEMPPNVERQETRSDDDQQGDQTPETE